MNVYELELIAKKAELNLIENRIVGLEVELIRELESLIDFRDRYTSQVSVLYRELDWINAEISRVLTTCIESPPPADENRLVEEADPTAIAVSTGMITVSTKRITRDRESEGLVSLFRRAAIKLHPDLATDDQERERRRHAMAQVNSAYEIGDHESIELILKHWGNNTGCVVLDAISKELNCIIRHLAFARKRLASLEREVAEVRSSEWYILFQKEKDLQSKGRDLIQMLSMDAKKEIAKAEKVLKSLRRNNCK